MSDLKFTCPATGQEIGSGIETDHDTLRRIQKYTLEVLCPHCREPHQISVKNGHFDKAA
jgi:hypothetical protein